MPPIALLSDLGEKDYFVGAMKGAVLSINQEASIVDISHQIPKQSVLTAAFVLVHASEAFPKGSIFVAVVDPGVGTERRCLLLRTKNGLNFVGPDNGVFTLVADIFEIEEIREITNRKLMRPMVSATFHGRDVMAPVAAHLSLGLDSSEVGPTVGSLKRLKVSMPRFEDDVLHAQVLHVDDFGNLVTNIDVSSLEELGEPKTRLGLKIGKTEIRAPFVRAFGEVSEGEKLCYIGSTGLLEIGINMGNLAEELNVSTEDKILLKTIS